MSKNISFIKFENFAEDKYIKVILSFNAYKVPFLGIYLHFW